VDRPGITPICQDKVSSFPDMSDHVRSGQVKVRSDLIRCKSNSGQIRSDRVRSARDSSVKVMSVHGHV